MIIEKLVKLMFNIRYEKWNEKLSKYCFLNILLLTNFDQQYKCLIKKETCPFVQFATNVWTYL